MASSYRTMTFRRPSALLALAVALLCACGTTTQTARLRVTATTDPDDAVVRLRHGERVLTETASPLAVDRDYEVEVPRRGGAWVVTVLGGIASLVGAAMLTGAGAKDDAAKGILRSTGAVILIPGIVLTGLGFVGLVRSLPPAFVVDAVKPGYTFTPRIVEPGDVPVPVFLKGQPEKVER